MRQWDLQRAGQVVLKWDEQTTQFTNERKTFAFVKRTPREGWEEKGI